VLRALPLQTSLAGGLSGTPLQWLTDLRMQVQMAAVPFNPLRMQAGSHFNTQAMQLNAEVSYDLMALVGLAWSAVKDAINAAAGLIDGMTNKLLTNELKLLVQVSQKTWPFLGRLQRCGERCWVVVLGELASEFHAGRRVRPLDS
jgi:hypothetical protein